MMDPIFYSPMCLSEKYCNLCEFGKMDPRDPTFYECTHPTRGILNLLEIQKEKEMEAKDKNTKCQEVTEYGEAPAVDAPRTYPKGNFYLTLEEIENIVNTLEGPAGAVVFSVKSIVKRMMEEWFVNGRTRSVYGMDGWWTLCEFLMGLMADNRNVPGVATYEKTMDTVRECIAKMEKTAEYDTKIAPCFDRWRYHHIERTIDALRRDKEKLESDRKAHPNKY